MIIALGPASWRAVDASHTTQTQSHHKRRGESIGRWYRSTPWNQSALVKIPLTIFAFLGGALALGVGFGAQNLLKNLMSGIILLIERPLCVGDIVEVGGSVGSVTNISIRASTVRSGAGIEALIPNANFLENAVTNWTYSDRRVRREIKLRPSDAKDEGPLARRPGEYGRQTPPFASGCAQRRSTRVTGKHSSCLPTFEVARSSRHRRHIAGFKIACPIEPS